MYVLESIWNEEKNVIGNIAWNKQNVEKKSRSAICRRKNVFTTFGSKPAGHLDNKNGIKSSEYL